jgi:p-cumate 2,3-dioxygenase subunit beta
MGAFISRIDVEDFLFREAELLDEWRLPEWLALFTDDAHYYVPSTDLAPDASPDNNLFYIADDRFRLGERVARLMKRTAHSEFPRSKVRHLVSNVRLHSTQDGEVGVRANFVTHRTKDGVTDQYVGSYRYRLLPHDGSFRILEKRCILDMDGLRPQGRISIIL